MLRLRVELVEQLDAQEQIRGQQQCILNGSIRRSIFEKSGSGPSWTLSLKKTPERRPEVVLHGLSLRYEYDEDDVP